MCHSLAPCSPPLAFDSPTNPPVHRSIGDLMIKRQPLAITINHHLYPFSLSRCPTPAVLVALRLPHPPGHQMGTRSRVFLATNFHSKATSLSVFESAFGSLHLNLPKNSPHHLPPFRLHPTSHLAVHSSPTVLWLYTPDRLEYPLEKRCTSHHCDHCGSDRDPKKTSWADDPKILRFDGWLIRFNHSCKTKPVTTWASRSYPCSIQHFRIHTQRDIYPA